MKPAYIAQLIGGNEHRAERAGTLIDLRLSKVQRILAFDIPGRNIVGKRVSKDFACASEQHGKFRFRRCELRIRPDADCFAWSDAHACRALEENFRTRITVYVRVKSLASAVLGVAKGRAGFISATAAPHLRRMDRKYGRRWSQ